MRISGEGICMLFLCTFFLVNSLQIVIRMGVHDNGGYVTVGDENARFLLRLAS
jgi:hypothetical protein